MPIYICQYTLRGEERGIRLERDVFRERHFKGGVINGFGHSLLHLPLNCSSPVPNKHLQVLQVGQSSEHCRKRARDRVVA